MPRTWIKPAVLVSAFAVACSGPLKKGDTDEHASEALTACPAGATVNGVDVSDYQGTVNWSDVKSSGVTFAYAKATEGLTINDTEFPTYWPAMKTAGITRGAYHFFHSADDGTEQADKFLSIVGTIEPGDLPPMLDWETNDSGVAITCAAGSTACAVYRAQAFINEIKARTGLDTVVYTYPDFWDNTLGTPSQFASDPFWIANYTGSLTSCPELLSPWTAWKIWQWSSTGTVSGISGQVDLDVFNGNASQLAAFAGGTTVSNGFSINVSPTTVSIPQGSSVSVTVGSAVTSGAAQVISLKVSGLPSGAVGSFTSTSVTAGAGTTLTISAGTAAAGTYPVTITGTAGGVSQTAALSLTIMGSMSTGSALTNGGFETGSLSPWVAAGAAEKVSTMHHTGSHSAMLGKLKPTTGDSSITQTFTAQTGASTLSFWYRPRCEDSSTVYGWATATLVDNTTGTTSTVLPKICVKSPHWSNVTSPVVAGHSYTLTLTSHDDGYSADPTFNLFDDVTVQ